MLAIVGGNLIDGSGRPVVEDTTVLIDGDRILEAGPRASVPIPEGAEVLDASGHTVMPGLIDVHDHLASGGYGLTGRWGMDEPMSLFNIRTAQVIEDTLAAGYTTVRGRRRSRRRLQDGRGAGTDQGSSSHHLD